MTILERRFPARWRRREEVEPPGYIAPERPMTEEEKLRELKAFGMPSALAMARGPDAIEPPPDA